MEEYLAELTPVNEWDWYLYRVSYMDNGGRVLKSIPLVSTLTHIADEVQRCAPNSSWSEVKWEELRSVGRPRQIGLIGSLRIYEGAREAGEREAKEGGI